MKLDYDTLIHLIKTFERFVIPVKKMYNEEFDDCFNEGVESCIIYMKEKLEESKTKIKKIKCPKCEGYGYTMEHDPHSIDRETGWHDCSSCPIQVQCEECCATGKIEIPEEDQINQNQS